MRPSSTWRKQSDDTGVDIFGNKKRGGGGDPIRTNAGSIVSNLSQYKVLQPKTHSPSRIPINTLQLSSANDPSDAHIPPHLRTSVHFNDPPKDTKRDAFKQSNELFRQQLDLQIAEQKQLKHAHKMNEMEQEKLAQDKLQRELEQLRLKHKNEINKESNANAGFLRYKNSHSHIPLPTIQKRHQSPLQVRDDMKQTDIDDIHGPRVVFTSNNTDVIQHAIPSTTNNIKSMEMRLLEEKLAWKQKISQQELELKQLKLQMLQQQHDQKTTLQYLLKLQTDFTEQIYSANQNTKRNIKRPLSGIPQPVSVQSSITYAPVTPQVLQVQSNHTPTHGITYPHGYPMPSKEVVQMSVSPIKQNCIQSSYFPMQPEVNHQPQPSMPSMYFNQTTTPTPKLTPQRPQPMFSRNSTEKTSPVAVTQQSMSPFQTPQVIHSIQPIQTMQVVEEQKQQSFLDTSTLHRDHFGALLQNESSFLEYDSSDEEMDSQNNEVNEPLRGSTVFEPSSRPLTAINPKERETLLLERNGGIDHESQEDPFTIHVVEDTNQEDEEWKKISDVDRDNMESLRDALQEISNVAVDGQDEENSDTIEDEVPVPSPHTSMNWGTFVVACEESKENEDDNSNDEEEEYEQDFENESQSEAQESIADKKHDVLRIPDLDSSINNFESKVYSVYSSFDNDQSMLTTSVASSSDFSHKSPQKIPCQPILE
eukprot:13261_1